MEVTGEKQVHTHGRVRAICGWRRREWNAYRLQLFKSP